VWSLGNGVFGTRGRFDGDQGHGLVVRLVVRSGRLMRVESVPIRIDNCRIDYQSRPCSAAEADRVLRALDATAQGGLGIEAGVGILDVP